MNGTLLSFYASGLFITIVADHTRAWDRGFQRGRRMTRSARHPGIGFQTAAVLLRRGSLAGCTTNTGSSRKPHERRVRIIAEYNVASPQGRRRGRSLVGF